MTRAYLSIGSNLGDKYENCLQGVDKVDALEQTRVVGVSKFYRTEPVDFLDQAWFVNGALKIETTLAPLLLIQRLKETERLMGQMEKEVRFGPRIIDLDIIFYGTTVMDTNILTIPHPRMHERCFVLKPLCDLETDMVHPVLGETMAGLLKRIENDHGQEVMEYIKGG
ncbi:MAG: 2-amino-4-hydroxy-6-hydroxymethyldihydropteridine diphosphokinase [Desulfobacterium sp.]|nr:2-amino-4-hydroxy-6-hydroxymethyldihydropteridine diphosphokinase [Desulfobacterium sp.]